jgi:glycosyltransferase involved in cell wall biosynthesis
MSNGLAKAIHKLASLPDDQSQKWGAAARRFVGDSFTRQQYFERTLDLYESLGVRLRAT